MPVSIPIRRLAKVCNPLSVNPWSCIPFGKKEIAKSLRVGEFVSYSKPVPDDTFNCWPHANRIAYLIRKGWSDAIEIDVGIPSLGYSPEWMIIDGNHRLAAAIYRKDKSILATVGGCLDYALKLFGVDCTELTEDGD